MKKIKIVSLLVFGLFFGNLSFSLEGVAVIDYNAIFLGTDLARERIDDLRDSEDYKDLTDEAAAKDGERLKLAEKLKKEESTLSDSEKEDIVKKVQTLFQSISFYLNKFKLKSKKLHRSFKLIRLRLFKKL